MTSLRARLLVWWLKWRIKPRLNRAGGAEGLLAARAMFNATPGRLPRGVVATPATLGGVAGEWVRMAGARPDAPILLYLHGGGYFACSPATHRAITGRFARRGFAVFAPDYRLAPEHRFPAALEDALAAWRALPAGGPAVVAGESAGGGLAAALLVALRDAGAALPAACAVFSPWTDLAGTGATLATNNRRDALFSGTRLAETAALYLGDTDPKTPLASPLYADLSGLPPLLIHVGRDEILRDDATRLAERARAAGVRTQLRVFPGVPHGWQLFLGLLPEAAASLDQAAAFLHRAQSGTTRRKP